MSNVNISTLRLESMKDLTNSSISAVSWFMLYPKVPLSCIPGSFLPRIREKEKSDKKDKLLRCRNTVLLKVSALLTLLSLWNPSRWPQAKTVHRDPHFGTPSSSAGVANSWLCRRHWGRLLHRQEQDLGTNQYHWRINVSGTIMLGSSFTGFPYLLIINETKMFACSKLMEQHLLSQLNWITDRTRKKNSNRVLNKTVSESKFQNSHFCNRNELTRTRGDRKEHTYRIHLWLRKPN